MTDAWKPVHEAQRLAKKQPDQLVAFLTQHRDLTDEKKRFTLDAVGAILAVAEVERPTLAELREAIAYADAEARNRRVDTQEPIIGNFDEVVLAFIVDTVWPGELQFPKSKPAHLGMPERPRTGGSAEMILKNDWVAETPTCTIRFEWENTWFPGDVNEPERESDYAVIVATRRDRPASIRFSASIGDREMYVIVDAPPDERDQILTKLWRAFAR